MGDVPVGRGRPPIETRFKKGKSGNPSGRPKGSRTHQPSAFDILLDRTILITEKGKTRPLSSEEALQHKTFQKAIAGDHKAQREMLKMLKTWQAARDKQHNVSTGVKRFVEHESPENLNEVLCLLGIATTGEIQDKTSGTIPRVSLEPWAVQMALDRRGLGELIPNDVRIIQRCTRNGKDLRWPKGTIMP